MDLRKDISILFASIDYSDPLVKLKKPFGWLFFHDPVIPLTFFSANFNTSRLDILINT